MTAPPQAMGDDEPAQALAHLLNRLCVRPHHDVLTEISAIMPQNPQHGRIRAYILGTDPHQAMAFSMFVIFEIVQQNLPVDPELTARLLDSLHRLFECTAELVPHNGSQEPQYNLLYGLYLTCLLREKAPTLIDFAAIFSYLTPEDRILAAYHQWCFDGAVVLDRRNNLYLYAGLMWTLRSWLLAANRQDQQLHILHQLMVAVEQWGAALSVQERVDAFNGQVTQTIGSEDTEEDNGIPDYEAQFGGGRPRLVNQQSRFAREMQELHQMTQALPPDAILRSAHTPPGASPRGGAPVDVVKVKAEPSDEGS